MGFSKSKRNKLLSAIKVFTLSIDNTSGIISTASMGKKSSEKPPDEGLYHLHFNKKMNLFSSDFQSWGYMLFYLRFF